MLGRMLAGEDIVIAKAGKPLARLIPVEARLPRTPGLAKGRVTEAFLIPYRKQNSRLGKHEILA